MSPEFCLRCGAPLDTEEGLQTGICPECWNEAEDGPLSLEEEEAE